MKIDEIKRALGVIVNAGRIVRAANIVSKVAVGAAAGFCLLTAFRMWRSK